jgi:HAD superfamily hydrolase (TIGR01509 family)
MISLKYSNYLFDLDGVLVDTTEIQYESTLNAVINLLDYNIKNDTNVDKIFRSTITTLDKLKYLSTIVPIDKDTIELIYQTKKNIANEYFNKLDPDYQKIELMKYLKEQQCKIAVVTNSNRESAITILKNIGVYQYIDILITNNDVLNAKPNPEPYLKAIELLNTDTKSCIIFEDSEEGIMSAKNANCDYYHVKSYLDLNTDLIINLN